MNQYNSVRISNIPKHQHVAAHLDNILEQTTWLLQTNFQHVKVFEHAKKLTDCHNQAELEEEKTTIAFVQLADSNKHDKLMIILNGYRFHNYTLSCIPAYHDFNSLKKVYHFDWSECEECDSFNDYVEQKQAEQDKNKVKQLYDRASKFVTRKTPARQSPTTQPKQSLKDEPSSQPPINDAAPSHQATVLVSQPPLPQSPSNTALEPTTAPATALTQDQLDSDDEPFYDLGDENFPKMNTRTAIVTITIQPSL